MKHGVLENGPQKFMIFLAGNLHSVDFSAMFDEIRRNMSSSADIYIYKYIYIYIHIYIYIYISYIYIYIYIYIYCDFSATFSRLSCMGFFAD